MAIVQVPFVAAKKAVSEITEIEGTSTALLIETSSLAKEVVS